jgi:hypothetical protein
MTGHEAAGKKSFVMGYEGLTNKARIKPLAERAAYEWWAGAALAPLYSS